MVFILSIALALALVFLFNNVIKKYANICYIIAALISVTVMLVAWFSVQLPLMFASRIWPVFARGGLAGALFVVVMITGALPNGSSLIKRLMPIRGELSILACILTLGHNAAYGKTYFVMLFTQADDMPLNQLLAACCSMVMLIIMMPLFITSFQAVRRRFRVKKWKRLQRLAYPFYALLYCHIILLYYPRAQAGVRTAQITVFAYSFVFGGYALCRICKAVAIRKKLQNNLVRWQKYAMVGWLLLISLVLGAVFQRYTSEVVVEASETKYTYSDGTYTGKAMGMNASIAVSVTVENGQIADIVIDSARDDEPYFSDALSVIDDILDSGSADVDTVSGATYSSGGIIDAVRNALEGALPE